MQLEKLINLAKSIYDNYNERFSQVQLEVQKRGSKEDWSTRELYPLKPFFYEQYFEEKPKVISNPNSSQMRNLTKNIYDNENNIIANEIYRQGNLSWFHYFFKLDDKSVCIKYYISKNSTRCYIELLFTTNQPLFLISYDSYYLRIQQYEYGEKGLIIKIIHKETYLEMQQEIRSPDTFLTYDDNGKLKDMWSFNDIGEKGYNVKDYQIQVYNQKEDI